MKTLVARMALGLVVAFVVLMAQTGTPTLTRATMMSSQTIALVSDACGEVGGAGCMPTSGFSGGYSPTFTNVATSTLHSVINNYDTVVLLQVCNIGTWLADQNWRDALHNWINAGHKLIIYDSDACGGMTLDYSQFIYPFTTNNPGQFGSNDGILEDVEENTLSSTDPSSQSYVDLLDIQNNTDAVGDASVMLTQDSHWMGDLRATNLFDFVGYTHTYAEYGSGLIIYNGLDSDYIGWNSSLAKLWELELKQQWDPSGLPGGHPVTPACASRTLVLVGGTPLFGADRDAEKSLADWTAGFEIKSLLMNSGEYGSSAVRLFSYSGASTYTGAHTRQSLSDSADRLDTQLHAWAQECADDGVQTKFDIVAHSLGGAVTAYWAGRSGSDLSLVGKVLTFNSPLGGIPAGNCVEPIVRAFAGQAGVDLCQSAVKDTMKRGTERVPWLVINDRADWVVNGCVAQGMTKADGKLNGTLSGRVWDSREIGLQLLPGAGPRPFVQCFAAVGIPLAGGVASGNVSPAEAAVIAAAITNLTIEAHGLPLKASCNCWDPLDDKLLNAQLLDDRAAPLSYSGTWVEHTNSTRVMATDSVSSKPGATLTLDVSGSPSKIVWIAMKGPSAGHAKVSVCGGAEQDINLNQPLFDARQEYEFSIPSSCSAPELKLRVPTWVDGKGRDMNIDAFEVWP